LLSTHARPEVRVKIESAFLRRARKNDAATLIEKTCANSLRVGFVHEIFPNARFVHLVRDGRSVAASASERWTASLDLPYLLRKARFVPRADLPYYAFRYLKTRLSRVRSDEKRLSWWGPRFHGMEDLSHDMPLVEVAAMQWKECVERALTQLAELPPRLVYQLDYRTLVTSPEESLSSLLDFLGTSVSAIDLRRSAGMIHGGSREKWREVLSPAEQKSVASIVAETNALLGIGQD